MTEKLSDTARETLLAPLLNSGWTMAEDRDALTKHFTFENFTDAIGWMMRAAFWAENGTITRNGATLTTASPSP